MGWDVPSSAPTTQSALYFLVLPTDCEVLYAYDPNGSPPMSHSGDYNSFAISHGDPPLIPMDTHHALLMDWVDMDRMARNRPYMDDAIKAAIALVA
jgi:hypothetical protein